MISLKSSTSNKLLSLYENEGDERGGYLTKEGEVVELENGALNKIDNFWFTVEGLEDIENNKNVIGLFHTHPSSSSNLSKEDADAFVNFPDYYHFIVGKNGLMCYKVSNKGTILIEDIEICE